MTKINPIGEILDAEISRREFIGLMGAAALAVTGVAGVAKGLKGIAEQTARHGYGSSAYGDGTKVGTKR